MEQTSSKKTNSNKKSTAACLKIAKQHLDVPEHYCQNFMWTDEQFSCLGEGGQGAIYTVEREKGTKYQHPNFTISGEAIMEVICCVRTMTSCYHRYEYEFPRLSGHFAGEFKAICPPIEAQQMFGDAMGQTLTAQE